MVDPELDLGFIEPKMYMKWHALCKNTNTNVLICEFYTGT